MLYGDNGFDGNLFSVRLLEEVGIVGDPERLEAYRRFAQEKAHRLYADWLRNPTGTLSSWQTRDENIHRSGGAVLFPRSIQGDYLSIVSFSGLKEAVDEAISLMLGNYRSMSSSEHNQRVVAASNNLVFPEMWERFSSLVQ